MYNTFQRLSTTNRTNKFKQIQTNFHKHKQKPKLWLFLLPARNSSIKRERNQELSRIILVGLQPQTLFLQIHIIPYSNSLLVLHIRRGRRHHGPTGVPPVCRVHVSPATMMVIIRSRKWHRHSRRPRRIITTRWVLIELRRISIRTRVLGRVGRHRGEDVTVGSDFLLRRRRRRRWGMTPSTPMPTAAVTTTATDVSHKLHKVQ